MDAQAVQIVENHAELSGQVVSVAPDPAQPGFVVLTVQVRAAADVAGYPNLFARDVGGTVALLARSDGAAARACPGAAVRLRVRKSGPGVAFAEE